MRIYIKSLGCRLNQYESDLIALAYKNQGHRIVSNPEEAELVVVNSCTVTSGADADTRKFLRKVKRVNPEVKVLVTGCYVSVPHGFAEVKNFSLSDAVAPNFEKYAFIDKCLLLDLPVPRAKAFVAIQRGCSWNCSYCLIKPARGLPVSRSHEDILREMLSLFENGVGEVVLTGTDLGLWKENGKGLSWLLSLLLEKVPSGKRLSVSSLGVQDLSPELIEVLDHPSMAKHLHISIQSFSGDILNKMRRPYDEVQVMNIMERLFAKLGGWGVGADIMVGFPFEKERDFRKTYRALRELPFSYFHVFPFSPRPGTEAWEWRRNMPPKEIVKERLSALLELSKRKRIAFVEEVLQRKRFLDVLVEKVEKGLACGTSSEYLKVCFEPGGGSIGMGRGIQIGAIVKALPAGYSEGNGRVVVKGTLDWSAASVE